MYEEIGEKLAILVSPFLAYYLDRGKETRVQAGRLAVVTLCVFAMEELVDSLLLIVMVKHEVNALRVKPAFSLRAALLLSAFIATMFGGLQIADRITWVGDEDAAPVSTGNSTAEY